MLWQLVKELILFPSYFVQVSKILKDRGRFISVTFSQPHFRKPFLAKSQYSWSISVQTFGDSFHFFFYVMEKGKPLSEDDKKMEIFIKNKINHVKTQWEKHDLFCELREDTEDFLFNVALQERNLLTCVYVHVNYFQFTNIMVTQIVLFSSQVILVYHVFFFFK